MQIIISGFSVLIDDDDFDRVSEKAWYVKQRSTKKKLYFRVEIKGVNISLHRFIINAPDGIIVDHINGDTLDNRKSNLRLATNSQNNMNAKRYKSNTSGFKGVTWRGGRSKRWRVRIGVNNKRIAVGSFLTKEEAHAAYVEAAKKYHGEFARFE